MNCSFARAVGAFLVPPYAIGEFPANHEKRFSQVNIKISTCVSQFRIENKTLRFHAVNNFSLISTYYQWIPERFEKLKRAGNVRHCAASASVPRWTAASEWTSWTAASCRFGGKANSTPTSSQTKINSFASFVSGRPGKQYKY
jgi:hypothetical protein